MLRRENKLFEVKYETMQAISLKDTRNKSMLQIYTWFVCKLNAYIPNEKSLTNTQCKYYSHHFASDFSAFLIWKYFKYQNRIWGIFLLVSFSLYTAKNIKEKQSDIITYKWKVTKMIQKTGISMTGQPWPGGTLIHLFHI